MASRHLAGWSARLAASWREMAPINFFGVFISNLVSSESFIIDSTSPFSTIGIASTRFTKNHAIMHTSCQIRPFVGWMVIFLVFRILLMKLHKIFSTIIFFVFGKSQSNWCYSTRFQGTCHGPKEVIFGSGTLHLRTLHLWMLHLRKLELWKF